MYKKMFRLPPLHRQPRILRLLLIAFFVCLSILSTLGSATTTLASGTPGGNIADPTVRAVDIAQPAVVRIITTLNSHLIVHFPSGDVTFPQGTPSSYPLVLSGSGTFITAHGDILTADHVVNPPHDRSLSQFLDDTARQDVANYINQKAKPGSPPVTPAQVSQELQSGQLPSDPNYDTPISEVYLSTQYTGPLSATDFSSLPPQIHATVDKIEQQSSFNDKDVAIVHVPMNDEASVQLGDSSNVQPQDALTIIGFPGNGDVGNSPTDVLTDSLNKITVSAIKTTDTGAQVIQVGGNVEHGDSGGPALDSSGAVVGIVSFGLSTPNEPGGTSFLQASNSARDLVQSLHLDTTPGPFEQAWSQAFIDYASTTPGHWHKSQQEFGKIAANYPQFKAITPYLTYTQAQAKNEHVQPRQGNSSGSSASQNSLIAYALIIGGIVIVLVLIFLLFAVARRQRRKKKSSADSSTPPMTQIGQAQASPPTAISKQPQSNGSGVSAQRGAAPKYDDAMTAFGAPPSSSSQTWTSKPPAQAGSQTIVSGVLRPWPCGHMNRSNARYCSICGEPAPPLPTIRKLEQ